MRLSTHVGRGVELVGFAVGLAVAGCLLATPLPDGGSVTSRALVSDNEHMQASVAAATYRGLVKTDDCASGFRLKGSKQCTTGPEPAPTQPETLAASAQDGALSNTEPHAVPCYGDGTSGPRLQAVYAVAEDRADRFETVLPVIRQAAGYADEVYNESAGQTGGERHLRWVTNANCELDVIHAVVPMAADDTFAALREALRAQGLVGPDRKYVVWTDANVYCGIATVPEDDRPGADNPANSAVHFARIDNSCWNYRNSIEAHEITHMLGGVQLSAPHSNNAWHCTDESDLMCYNDGVGSAVTAVCALEQEPYLDCNKDDYFNTSPESGSYLDSHWNVANSVFLERADGSYPALPTATSWNWSGSLSRKTSSVDHRQGLASGGVEATMTFTKVKSLRLTVIDPLGNVAGTAQGASPLTVRAPATAGTYTFRVDGATSGSYTLKVQGYRNP